MVIALTSKQRHEWLLAYLTKLNKPVAVNDPQLIVDYMSNTNVRATNTTSEVQLLSYDLSALHSKSLVVRTKPTGSASKGPIKWIYSVNKGA
jgi:hypothetical protein